jgi:NAD(P)-dependent dehydrogenase (short-subunit alcohol dehydrogenase family)
MDKVCAVVGVGPGLGIAIAERFAKGGYKTALLGRRLYKVEDYERSLRERGLDATAFVSDASQPDDVARALGDVRGRLGKIDVLVYNAFAVHTKALSDLTPEELIDDFRVNVAGALAAVHAVSPAMRAKGSGAILLTGAVGTRPDDEPESASLSVGKAALHRLVLLLARDLAPSGIRVSTLTIRGAICVGTDFDPEKVAEAYWKAAAEPHEAWLDEVTVG